MLTRAELRYGQAGLASDDRRRGLIDADLIPYRDQWAFLASIQPMAPHDVEPTILRATGGISIPWT